MSLPLASSSSEKTLSADAGAGESEDEFLVNVKIPEIRVQTFLSQKLDDTIWNFKQRILDTVASKLVDGLNYGVYCPPANGKAGKFMDEERCWKEYAPHDRQAVEIVYKKRIYKALTFNSRKVKEVNFKSGQKKFLGYLKAGNVEKIAKLLAKGLDPNFQDSQTGETPFTTAVLRKLPREMFMTLVDGGAHLDFRNRAGLTPLHCAAQTGNKVAVQTLLNFGASPNYKDVKGLTPLYHCVCHDTDPNCVDLLLREYALHGVTDETGWTEVHQACKHGRVQHLQHLLFYGANMNSRNSSGNTPLHVCAIINQEDCARLLLFRGADKSLTNFSNQDPVAAAIMAGNQPLADEIRKFRPEDVVRLHETPHYNPKRRTLVWQAQQSTLLRQRKFSHSTPQLHLLRDVPNRPGLPWMDKQPRLAATQSNDGLSYDSDSPPSIYSEIHDTDSDNCSELAEAPNFLYATIAKNDKTKGEIRLETGSLNILPTSSDSDYQSIRSLSPSAFIYRKKAETEPDSKTASIRSYPKRLTPSIFQDGLFQVDVEPTPTKTPVPATSLQSDERSRKRLTTFEAIERADSSPDLLLDDVGGRSASAIERNNLLLSPPPGVLSKQRAFGSANDLLEGSTKGPFSGSNRSGDDVRGYSTVPKKIPFSLRTYGSNNDLLEKDNQVKALYLHSSGEPNQGTGILRKPTPVIPENVKSRGSNCELVTSKDGSLARVDPEGNRDTQTWKLSVAGNLRSYGSSNDLLDSDAHTYLSLPGSEKDQAHRFLAQKQLRNSGNMATLLNRQYGSVDNLSKPEYSQVAGTQSRKKIPPPPPPARRSQGPLEFDAKEQHKVPTRISGISTELLEKFEQQNRPQDGAQPPKTSEKKNGRESSNITSYDQKSLTLLPEPPTDLFKTNIPPPPVFKDNPSDITVADLPLPPFPDHVRISDSFGSGPTSSAWASSFVLPDLPPPPLLEKETEREQPIGGGQATVLPATSKLTGSTVSNASNDTSSLHASLIAAVLKRRNCANLGHKDGIEVPEANLKSLNSEKPPSGYGGTVTSTIPGQPKVSTATVSGQGISSATVSGQGTSSATVSGQGISSATVSGKGVSSTNTLSHGSSTALDQPMISEAGDRGTGKDFIQQAEMMLQTLRRKEAEKHVESHASGNPEVSQALLPPPPPSFSSPAAPSPTTPSSSSSASSPAPPPPPPPPPLPSLPPSSFTIRRSSGQHNPDATSSSDSISSQTSTSMDAPTDPSTQPLKPKQPLAPSGGLSGLAEIVAKKALERQRKSLDNGTTE